MQITRVSRLTCAACGYTDQVRIAVFGSTEVMPQCESCGACEWVSWPKLREDGLIPVVERYDRTSSLLDVPYMPTNEEFISIFRAFLGTFGAEDDG